MADACNELGQALAGQIEAGNSKAIPTAMAHSCDKSIATILNEALEKFYDEMLAPSYDAEFYYKSAIQLFDYIAISSDEVRNVIASECNRSSLKRLLAMRSSEIISKSLSPFIERSRDDDCDEKNLGSPHKLCILMRCLLGKKNNGFEHSLASCLTSKARKGTKKNSSVLVDCNGDHFRYQYEPLALIEEGLSICDSMQAKIEKHVGESMPISDQGSSSSRMVDPTMRMIASEMARHNFLKGKQGSMGFACCLLIISFASGMLYKQCNQHISAAADDGIKKLMGEKKVTDEVIGFVGARDSFIKSAIDSFRKGKTSSTSAVIDNM